MSRPIICSNSIWITTTAFTQLFTGMKVRRIDENTGRYGEANADIPVDISLDTKERIYYQLKYGGYKKMEQADTRLPRIGIQIQAINPAIDRYTGKMRGRRLKINNTYDQNGVISNRDSFFDIQPVPCDITYLVTVWCQNVEYWTQIMENIIPWYDSYMLVGVKERNLNIEREIKVTLESVSPNFSFAMNSTTDKRIVRGELTFKCETVMYKLQNTGGNVIEKVFVDIIDVTSPITSETITIEYKPNT